MRAKTKMKAQDEITNGEDILDSRDVIARIEYLEGERETLSEAVEERRSEYLEATEDEEIEEAKEAERAAVEALEEWDQSEEADELKALKALTEEAEGYCSDWHHGEALIRDSYFEDYARQLAEDIGAIPDDAKWPCTCIDWEKAAEELRMDYTAVSFGEVTYWTR